MAIHISLQRSVAYFSLLCAGAVGGVLGTQLLPTQASLRQPLVAQQPLTRPSTTLPENFSSNFIASAVERTGPAVVRIEASRTVSNRVREGSGSGFVIQADGVILTNAHVVEGADSVKVTLKDGRDFTGQVLGRDSLTDVAVVKIQANNLPVVAVGNSEQLKPGEWAIAIGNPLGLDNTVTAGIISATGRSSSAIGVPDKRIGFIQTDAAINPGNSGGPLLNQQGQVIGMNTAIIGGAQGLGFAIPINRAQQIAEQLITKGQVDHAYLGVQMATLTPTLKENLARESRGSIQVQADQGVIIVGIAKNSPADQAGLQPGDVIQQVGSNAVRTADQIQEAVDNSTIGSNLPLEINRNGRNLTLSVIPGKFPSQVPG
jgi:S1-C subfamily serine protease